MERVVTPSPMDSKILRTFSMPRELDLTRIILTRSLCPPLSCHRRPVSQPNTLQFLSLRQSLRVEMLNTNCLSQRRILNHRMAVCYRRPHTTFAPHLWTLQVLCFQKPVQSPIFRGPEISRPYSKEWPSLHRRSRHHYVNTHGQRHYGTANGLDAREDLVPETFSSKSTNKVTVRRANIPQ